MLLSDLHFVQEPGRIVIKNDQGQEFGHISYIPGNQPDVVVANSTYVSDELRGQGVAGKLLDALADQMRAENKKIEPLCSFVVKAFEKMPEKYQDVQA